MENTDPNMENPHNGGALSIYGQSDAAMDDFPVLKAFQQYIDAEQSKSRKRMIMLCMFFGALMTILVAVFVFMLAQMNRDKQHVNDQLIQFLMKERERPPTTPAPAPVVQSVKDPATDAALKAMTETLAGLQKQMEERRKADEEAAAAAPSKAEIELERKTEREAAKLRRIQEGIEAEKRALKEEKERLHKEEVERQRRRLYPEYYQRTEGVQPQAASPSQPIASPSQAAQSPSPAPVAKKPPRVLTDADIDDILREVDQLKAEDEERESAAAKAKTKAKGAEKKSKPKDKSKKDDKETKDDQPIEYFTDTEAALPVKMNGEDSSWSFPLD